MSLLKTLEYKVPTTRLITDKLVDHKYKKAYRESSRILEEMRDIHKGERCFVIGTGPSLSKTPISLLKDEICFGVNILVTNHSLGINCKYYGQAGIDDDCPINQKVIDNLDGTLFLFRNAARDYLDMNIKSDKVVPVRTYGLIKNKFPKNISQNVYGGGGSVIIPCLQLVYLFGFKEVYLLGCDSNYDREGHFTKQDVRFVGKTGNSHWNTVFNAFKVCKDEFENDGRTIYNSTVGGKLEEFERKSLEDIK